MRVCFCVHARERDDVTGVSVRAREIGMVDGMRLSDCLIEEV